MTERQPRNDDSTSPPESSEDHERPPRPFLDAVLEALASWQRREICLYFMETDVDTANVDELAALVAARTPEMWADQRIPSQETLRSSLEETHLPHLAAAGVIDYDDRQHTVRYRGQATVEKWLEHMVAVDRQCC